MVISDFLQLYNNYYDFVDFYGTIIFHLDPKYDLEEV